MRQEGLGSLIAKIAVTDEQTGLGTFAHFQQFLERELDRGKRYGHSVTVVFLHVDARLGFDSPEKIQEGDRLLRRFADVLRETARTVDVVARRSVEEFAGALPETDAKAAAAFVGRLRAKLAATPFPGREAGAPAVHVGSSTCPRDTEDLRQLLSFADKSLLRAQRGAGGGYCPFDPDLDHAGDPSPRLH